MTITIPRPPLNLAVFNSNMAGQIIHDNPETAWYVGGHSLGGAMACRFADRNTADESGLVLLGSYCDRDLQGSGLRVISVVGSADTVLHRAAYRDNREFLPDDSTTEVTIQGMNHTQFGAYDGQPGDSPATISKAVAHERLQTVLTELFGV